MPRPLELSGTPASAGYAEGAVCVLRRVDGGYRNSGDPQAERARLADAVAAAAARVAALIGSAEDMGAEMLEFQLAMLQDEALIAPAFTAIAAGGSAAGAWDAAMAAEIAGYEAAEDEYFRARASDLRDIRDHVASALTGAGAPPPVPVGAIVVGEDLTPSQFLSVDWSRGGGIALKSGSASSHVAMLARSRGVPMLVGLGSFMSEDGEAALLDAEAGRLTLMPDAGVRAAFAASRSAFADRLGDAAARLSEPAATADGTAIEVMVNIASPAEAEALDVAVCDGVGLMRTEFLFDAGLPDEQTQYRAYARVLDWAEGRPVIIRTVDAGGDKPVPGLTVEETNPFLGLRGIRLSLARPDVFRVQARALLRAAVHGDLKVMLPMVTRVEEYRAACRIIAEAATALAAAGVAHAPFDTGIMVEVPAVALAPELLAEAAFFSIGSNDLTQYVMAAARDNGAVALLGDTGHPAVMALIGKVVAFGRETGMPVSLCGDAGGDPALIGKLLAAGIRRLSVAPAQLAGAKAAISKVRLGAEAGDG